MAPAEMATNARLRVRVRGAVQGVGFRPFVHGLAHKFALGGFVRNDARGVLLEVEGAHIMEFVEALRRDPPPLARIDHIHLEPIAPKREQEFSIELSRSGKAHTRIVPDAAVCDACLDDLFDPASRFHRYAFVNCTHCGPRYTLTRRLPYDRPQTSMARFAMCEDCERDYHDPANRRFHAQPIACPRCGPQLDCSIDDIFESIRSGGIVALKGVGGFHLLCDARNERAVSELRRRKGRDTKPFAVMACNAASAARIGVFGADELRLLQSSARPIVVVDKREELAPSVAPGLSRNGIVLPYAPVHHLLFHAAAGYPADKSWRDEPHEFTLIATSANPGGEPLIIEDAEARAKLASIADLIVGHDRAIVARADDSVMTMIAGAPAFLRRARGFVPEPIELATDGPNALALGAHLKTTVTVTRGREAFISAHIGSLDNRATIAFHEETVRRMLAILDVRPEVVACDLHPDLYSTRWAESSGLPVSRVQHHAAHVAAIAAEHGVEEPILGAALDGYGYGDDGGAWGGELMLIENGAWRRVGHLAPLPLPGGDRAAREPWRMAVAAIARLGRADEASERFPQVIQATSVARLAASATIAQTTSLGRMFDAAAALLGVRLMQDYEGQAAMELEALCREPRILSGGFTISQGVLDLTPLLAALLEPTLSAAEGSELFHGTLIEAFAAWIGDVSLSLGHKRVALGGGCLMNAVIADGLSRRLREQGVEPLLARKAPSNDGGLSLGQAFIARDAARARIS
ncbi:MAG: carbamoyltransferase HypF [Methylocystis sp.]|nr:carbamoyltransferase HypF [Methylocystis sp.]